MRCPHCNGEHPDDYRFCPKTAKEIVPQLKACTNADCPDYGKQILPLEAKFCPRCGKPIGSATKANSEANGSKAQSARLDFASACSEINKLFNLKK